MELVTLSVSLPGALTAPLRVLLPTPPLPGLVATVAVVRGTAVLVLVLVTLVVLTVVAAVIAAGVLLLLLLLLVVP